MAILTAEETKKLDQACLNLSEEEKVRHVGVINSLGHLVAGGLRKGTDSLLSDQKVRMLYMQMQLDFNMRKEMDDVLGSIDYIASRRKNLLVISIPVGDNLVLITAEPNADDRKIIKKAEDLFDDIKISTI